MCALFDLRTKVVDFLEADDVGVSKGKLLEDAWGALLPLQMLRIGACEFPKLGEAIREDIPLQDAQLVVNGALAWAHWQHCAR